MAQTSLYSEIPLSQRSTSSVAVHRDFIQLDSTPLYRLMRFLTAILALVASVSAGLLEEAVFVPNPDFSEDQNAQALASLDDLKDGMCNGDFLSALHSSSDFTGTDGTYNYYANFCGAINDRLCNNYFTSMNVGVCQRQANQQSCGSPTQQVYCYNLGIWAPATSQPTLTPAMGGYTVSFTNGSLKLVNIDPLTNRIR